MAQLTPTFFAPLAARFTFEYIEDTLKRWSDNRPWKVTCRSCGREFNPLETTGAAANLEAHRCGRVE